MVAEVEEVRRVKGGEGEEKKKINPRTLVQHNS